jgi:transcriptional regulator with XRE-family HTH domain
MFESLGARIRQMREEQELTREQLYARTKILPKYIEALENGRWDLLPGQMYVKPFVKSLSDALGADANELYALIDKQETPTPPSTPENSVPQPRGGFDYRWAVTAGMLVVAIAIILVFRSYMTHKDVQTLKSNMSSMTAKPAGYTRSLKYSSKLDFEPKLIPETDYRHLELTAREPIKIVLIAGLDTLFNSVLEIGKTIKSKSTKPLVLNLQKADCLDIIFDGQKMNESEIVKYKRYIVFPGSDLTARHVEATVNAGK